MNKQAIWAIAEKDMRAITSNLQVWLPMAIVPAVMGIVIPTLFVFLIGRFGNAGNTTQQLMQMMNRLPTSALKAALDALPTMAHKFTFLAANYLMAPFFLLIPLMTGSVIASESFAGEKERSTLETLLFAPVDLFSLFAGKVLAGLLPAVLLSIGTWAIALVSVNAAGWPLFHRLFFPQWNWLPLMLLVIPMLSLLAVLVTVFVSARATTFQGAYQSGALLVLPFLLLIFGQVTGVLVLSTAVVVVLGLALAGLNGVLTWLIVQRLDRSALFQSQIK